MITWATCRVAMTTMAETRLGRIWRKMMRSVAHAERAAGHHEVALADGQGLGPDDARVDRPAGHAEHDDHVDEARPEHGDDGERQQHEGKGQHDVDERHDRPVACARRSSRRPSPSSTPMVADRSTAATPDHQRHAAAVDHARRGDRGPTWSVPSRCCGACRRPSTPAAPAGGGCSRRADRGARSTARATALATISRRTPAAARPQRSRRRRRSARRAAPGVGARVAAELGERDLGRGAHRLHAPARMRGSMNPTTRSTMRFTATMTQGEQDHRALDHREVLVADRLHGERGHAGPREHRLGDDGAAEELAELQARAP